jgi:hypothetical protein
MQIEKDKSKDASAETYGTTYYPGTLDPGQALAIQVDPGADLQGVNIRLLHTKAVRITGRVTGSDGALPGPLVMVVLSSVGGSNSFDSQVRGDGSFELIQVPSGKYILSAIGMLEHGKQVAYQPVDVGEADVDDVQLTLSPQQTVTGKVVMPPGRRVPQGLVVVLQSREHLNGFTDGAGAGGFTQPREDGAFSIEGVISGDYDVVLANAGKGDDLYVDSIRSGDQDIFSSGFHVGPTTRPPVEITLKPNGGEIDCTVLDAKAKPVPDAQVTLLPDSPRTAQIALRSGCQTDASGKCVLLGIAPGDYHAFAFAKEDQVDFSDPEVRVSLDKAGKAVSVVHGHQQPMQLNVLQLEQE